MEHDGTIVIYAGSSGLINTIFNEYERNENRNSGGNGC